VRLCKEQIIECYAGLSSNDNSWNSWSVEHEFLSLYQTVPHVVHKPIGLYYTIYTAPSELNSNCCLTGLR